MAIRVLDFSKSFTVGVNVDLGLSLSLALTKLGTYCKANSLSYSNVAWRIDVDIPTGALIFNFSCRVFPNTYASAFDAQAQGETTVGRSALQ